MIWLLPPIPFSKFSLFLSLSVCFQSSSLTEEGEGRSQITRRRGGLVPCIQYNALTSLWLWRKKGLLVKSTIAVIGQWGIQFSSWFLTNQVQISHNCCIMKCEISSQMKHSFILSCRGSIQYLWFFVNINYNYMKLKHRVRFTGLAWQKQNFILCNTEK